VGHEKLSSIAFYPVRPIWPRQMRTPQHPSRDGADDDRVRFQGRLTSFSYRRSRDSAIRRRSAILHRARRWSGSGSLARLRPDAFVTRHRLPIRIAGPWTACLIEESGREHRRIPKPHPGNLGARSPSGGRNDGPPKGFGWGNHPTLRNQKLSDRGRIETDVLPTPTASYEGILICETRRRCRMSDRPAIRVEAWGKDDLPFSRSCLETHG